MVTNPDVFDVKATYKSETANEYDKQAEKEYQESVKKGLQFDQLNILGNLYYEKLYKDPKVTTSTYSFLHTNSYSDTDVNDKTDTYINMNISYRYIKYNKDEAGNFYDELYPNDCNRRTDSPQKVFGNIIRKLQFLGYDKIYKDGKREKNTFQTDLDFMYAIGLFQANTEKGEVNKDFLSKKDFRVGPKTIVSLLQTVKKLEVKDQPTTTTSVENKDKAISSSPDITQNTSPETPESTQQQLEQSSPPASEIMDIISKVHLSAGKTEGNRKEGVYLNSFDAIYSFIEDDLLGRYLNNEEIPLTKTLIRKKHFKEAVKMYQGSENPYFDAYKKLIAEIQPPQDVPQRRMYYTSLFLSSMKDNDKKLTYDPNYILKTITPEERTSLTKGIDLQPILGVISNDPKFKASPDSNKLPLHSIQDIFSVYNAALENYRKEKGTQNKTQN